MRFNQYDIYTWSEGDQSLPPLLLLHGFPTSSRDFRPLVQQLKEHYYVVGFDFLGFGQSQKHALPPLSIHLQADIAQAVMQHHRLKQPILLAHDYGLTVAQELLARRESFRHLYLLNGGAYSHLHRPLLIQKLLRSRIAGPLISQFSNKKLFLRNLQSVLKAPVDQQWIEEAWRDICLNNGHKIFHHLIHYIGDREQHAERWAQSLRDHQDQLSFIWGTLDPISGAHMLTELQRQLPRSRFYPLEIGHYPQWEATHQLALRLTSF